MRAAERDQTAFALDLFRVLARKPGNVFFSSLSIAAALEMAWAGARGATAQEIASVLRLTETEGNGSDGFARQIRDLVQSAGPDVELSVASRLWGQTGCKFHDSYLGIVRERYGADLTGVDFSEPAVAAHTINTWVAEATRGRVSELVPAMALSRLTKLVLTNAVYFKGQWRSPFDSSRTAPAPFWLDAERAVEAPLMTYQGQDEFGYASSDGWQLVELPYRGGCLVMDLIKPADDQPPSFVEVMMLAFKGRPRPPELALTLDELEARLTPEVLGRRLASLETRHVIVQMPRFELGQAANLSEPLKELGIDRAFSPAEADFSGITPGETYWLGSVLHRSQLRVDELGTEAAAATAVGMVTGVPAVFRADHPFLLLIRDSRTGAILFMGRVSNPVDGAAS